MRPFRLHPAFAFVALAVTGLAAAAALGHMARAFDGDSLQLADGRELRLLGINAPEFGRDGAPDQPLAAAARARVEQLADGRALRLRFGPEREDHYGRLLAYVELPDGRELQEVLLEEGLAWVVAIAPNVAHVEAYRAAEARARRQRRGVWALEAYRPVPAERLRANQTGFHRVAGTVRSARVRGQRLELALAPHFRLVVPRSFQSLLGADPVGKRVVARGWVSAYRRQLRLRISHPAMLEAVL